MEENKDKSQLKTEAKEKWKTISELGAEESLRQIKRMVGSALQRMMKSSHRVDSEELAVSIWSELWMSGGVITWTFVRNRTIDEIRRQVVRREVELGREVRESEEWEEEVGEEDGHDHLRDVATKEMVNRVMRCPTLAQEDKTMIYLRFYEGLRGEDIGSRFGCSKQKINQRLNEILAKLREWSDLIKDMEERKNEYGL